MRWVLIFLGCLLALSLISQQFHYVPGQEEKPSLAKASLCGVAEGMHEALLDHSTADGLIVETDTSIDRVYVLVVDDAKWAEEPIENKEVLAIAAWCQVAGEDGRAVASVIGNRAKDELASVVEGEFSIAEGTN